MSTSVDTYRGYAKPTSSTYSAALLIVCFAWLCVVGLVVSYGAFVGLSWLCSRDTIAMKSWVWQTHEQNPRHFCLFPRVEIDAVLT